MGNFDTDFTREKAHLTLPDKDLMKTMNQNVFDGFSFTNMIMARNWLQLPPVTVEVGMAAISFYLGMTARRLRIF